MRYVLACCFFATACCAPSGGPAPASSSKPVPTATEIPIAFTAKAEPMPAKVGQKVVMKMEVSNKGTVPIDGFEIEIDLSDVMVLSTPGCVMKSQSMKCNMPIAPGKSLTPSFVFQGTKPGKRSGYLHLYGTTQSLSGPKDLGFDVLFI